ncbi:MAG: lipopolysaccharide heptosyltransferase II [Candidatus Solibacter usitatus]|nr:lipopolysaccharide heptosyltransferase II [Candidatus Solibacter usitatus]
MSLPALRALRERFPEAEIAVLARPWVADLYAGESSIRRVIPYGPRGGWRDWGAKWRVAQELRSERFDCAILFQNAFEAALVARLAGIPRRIGYDRDGRGWLLTDAVPVPRPGEIPRHERYYYLELLRRAAILEALPDVEAIRLEERGSEAGRKRFAELGVSPPVIGLSPGAAYGGAKRWIPSHFAAAAARLGDRVALFGSESERALCEEIAVEIRNRGAAAHNLAGQTTLREFIELAAACRLYLTNDSGAMHIASALGVPTVAIFGPTDDTTTGPTGPLARVVREPVECSPCLLRECPIDHRCMTRVTPERVVSVALDLVK